jgi:hydroxyacylglutathione hydrolase
MNLITPPAFTDNHNGMLRDGRRAIVVDPGESAPVIEALDAQQRVLAAILVNRHAADHSASVEASREPVVALAALRQWKNNLR